MSSTLDGDTHLGHGGRYPRGQSIVGGVNVVLGDAVGDTVFGDGNIFGDRGEDGKRVGWSEGWRKWWERRGDDKNGSGRKTVMSTTRWLATTHGIKNKRRMYVSLFYLYTQSTKCRFILGPMNASADQNRYLVYYFPFLQWVTQYRWAFFKGDLIAALTMASFYLPMSLSYASNLGHIPPINGLYSFVFNPFVYALFGSCPQMVVGPEAAGSLLLGSVIKSSINGGNHGDDDDAMNARVAGVVTGMAGAVIFIAGITRLGFLDSVLSRPFLRGFISAIGFVILVDQLIPEMGLGHLAKHVGGASHGSSLDKIIFLVENVKNAHGLTCAVAFGSFAVIMVCRSVMDVVLRTFLGNPPDC